MFYKLLLTPFQALSWISLLWGILGVWSMTVMGMRRGFMGWVRTAAAFGGVHPQMEHHNSLLCCLLESRAGPPAPMGHNSALILLLLQVYHLLWKQKNNKRQLSTHWVMLMSVSFGFKIISSFFLKDFFGDCLNFNASEAFSRCLSKI